MQRKQRDNDPLMMAIVFIVFAIMLLFLITSAVCKADQDSQLRPDKGWLVRGSAVPWHDPPRSWCFWM